MELANAFSTFLSSIQPDERAVTAAKSAHERVREELRTDNESKDAHKDTFLSGSYARHTAVRDINDVDIICIVDIDHAITPPEVVLSWIHSVLSRYYQETRLQGRSVGANAAKDVWLDIVPSTPVSAEDGPLWIPDREARQWVQTHPKGQIAAAVNRNKVTNGFFVQTVKLLKAWRDRLPTDSCRLKSYILEALVQPTIGSPSSHASAVVNVLEGVERNYGTYRNSGMVPTIADPGFSSINVAKRWSVTDFNDFMAQVKSSAATARSALNCADEANSLKLWRKLFSAEFGK